MTTLTLYINNRPLTWDESVVKEDLFKGGSGLVNEPNFVKWLRTDSSGYCPDDDEYLCKYGNRAFWRVLTESTNVDFIKTLSFKLMNDMAEPNSTEFAVTNWVVRKHFLDMFTPMLKKHFFLLKEFITQYMINSSHYIDEAECDEIEMLRNAGVSLKAKDILEWVMDIIISHKCADVYYVEDFAYWDDINEESMGVFNAFKSIFKEPYISSMGIERLEYPEQKQDKAYAEANWVREKVLFGVVDNLDEKYEKAKYLLEKNAEVQCRENGLNKSAVLKTAHRLLKKQHVTERRALFTDYISHPDYVPFKHADADTKKKIIAQIYAYCIDEPTFCSYFG